MSSVKHRSSIKVDDFIAPECHGQIAIVYQDEAIVVINKPTGLLSLSGKNPLNFDSVHYRLRQLFPTCLMVHRLDLGTSGLMVLALNKTVNAHLCKQFQDRQVEKQYVAMLAGHVQGASGEISAAISKDPDNFPVMKICATTGKAATTTYRVLDYLDHPKRTRIAFTPLTGRTHQLRIHSREFGHPIIGCDLYGCPETQAMASRLLLHACDLTFIHPLTHAVLSFSCEADF